MLDLGDEKISRGRIVVGFSKCCALVFAGLAGTAVAPDVAEAAPYCCGLVFYPGGPFCPGGSSFTCPYGGSPKTWYCCDNGRAYGCGECTTGSDCFHPDWKCSVWWGTGIVC
jgi:hypothetical protein